MSSRVVEARREEGLYFVSFEKFGDGGQRISLKISLHFTDVRFVPPPLSRCNFRPMEAIEKSFGARPLHAFEFHAKIGIIRKPARRFSSPRPSPASPPATWRGSVLGGGRCRYREVPRSPCSEEDQRPDKSSSSRGPPARERPALRASTLVHCPRPSSRLRST